ncbi:MAG: hypothetical protein ACRDK4_05055 [Solirubrobacteraceae bacterium]
MQKLLGRLTPATVTSFLVATLALLAAFGLPITQVQSDSILVFGGALALILFAHGVSNALTYLTPQTVVGLVTGAIGVAVAFGLPVTKAQSDSILELTALFAGILLTHGVVQTARDRHVVVQANQFFGAPRAEDMYSRYKTGRRKPKNAPALRLGKILTGVLPAVPVAADHFKGATFGLYGNDKYGDCGPTSVANLARLVSRALAGVEVVPSQADVFDLYRRSGNPTFNPTTGAGDNGVDMQTMLEALLEGGIGDGKGGTIKPVAFAKASVTSDAELEAAVAVFGGCLWGVNLETSQQAQSGLKPPKWDHKPSSKWGGHAVLNGKYEPEGSGVDSEVISWEMDVEATDAFKANQLEEAWIVIFPWHLEHPAFLAGVDLQALAAEYKALTGKELVLPSPAPAPSPAPVGPGASEADRHLWEGVEEWVVGRHGSTTRPVAAKLRDWAKAIGLAG